MVERNTRYLEHFAGNDEATGLIKRNLQAGSNYGYDPFPPLRTIEVRR